ncbi:MAG: endolytic transglycosylase MltG [Parcubacteria group bacterium]|nr:endolytic transglycosylase MltG [Parcubacteria group bacterium]
MKKTALAIVVLLLFSVAVFGYFVTHSVLVPEASRTFVIARGESVMRISANLRGGGIGIRDFWFRTYVWLVRKEGAFLAGSFELPPKASIEELVHVLTTKGARPTRTIKILEGWGSGEIAAYFEKEGLFQQEDFIRLVGAPGAFATADNDFYNELVRESPLLVHRTAAAPLEGFLFPDT